MADVKVIMLFFCVMKTFNAIKLFFLRINLKLKMLQPRPLEWSLDNVTVLQPDQIISVVCFFVLRFTHKWQGFIKHVGRNFYLAITLLSFLFFDIRKYQHLKTDISIVLRPTMPIGCGFCDIFSNGFKF